jgi:hypothetical protein
MYCIADSVEDQFWGPYTKKPLADKVLKFVRKAVDPEAEIHEQECDEYEKEIMAGLLPIKICLEIQGGHPKEPQVDICWPPHEEGLIMCQETYREYFVWAKTRTEAILKIARMDVPVNQESVVAERDSEVVLI